MITRISDNTRFNTITGNISSLQTATGRTEEKFSNQKKINHPSDDPDGAKLVLNLRAAAAAIDQYRDNIVTGENWLKITADNLSGIDAFLKQAQAAVQDIGASSSFLDKAAAAASIQDIADQMLSLSNAQLNGQYLFSGSKGAMPFPDGAGAYQG